MIELGNRKGPAASSQFYRLVPCCFAALCVLKLTGQLQFPTQPAGMIRSFVHFIPFVAATLFLSVVIQFFLQAHTARLTVPPISHSITHSLDCVVLHAYSTL